jgi:putative SOS response-associated peptidase YedK
MCANFRPASIDTFRDGIFPDIRDSKNTFNGEVFPNGTAPIIRLELNAAGDRDEPIWTPARFGLVPPWVKPKEIAKFGRIAYNSRSETSAEKPTFRGAWSRRQFCLVPGAAFFEPKWETNSPVRWRIEMASGKPFAIAGIWERHGEGEKYFESFSMLTVNADHHEVMNHFHRREDEKRMPVIVEPDKYRAWLEATPTTAPQIFNTYPAELMTARPEPLPLRMKLAKPRAKTTSDHASQELDLF